MSVDPSFVHGHLSSVYRRASLTFSPSFVYKHVLEKTKDRAGSSRGSHDDGCALARECAKTKILRIPSRRAQRALVRVAPAVRKLDPRV